MEQDEKPECVNYKFVSGDKSYYDLNMVKFKDKDSVVIGIRADSINQVKMSNVEDGVVIAIRDDINSIAMLYEVLHLVLEELNSYLIDKEVGIQQKSYIN